MSKPIDNSASACSGTSGLKSDYFCQWLRESAAAKHYRSPLDSDSITAPLAALMMLPPDQSTFRAVSAVLKANNPIEENASGVYEQCEALAGSEADELILECRKTGPVPVSPWSDEPKVLGAARRALIRAGYSASLLD